MKCPKCGKHYEQDGKWCWDCGDELEPEPARRAEKDSRSSSGYAQWRRQAIGEVARLCEEAMDHDTSWPMFCALVKQRLETETALSPAHTEKVSERET